MIPGKTKYSTNKELVPGAAEAEVDGASIWTLHCTKSHLQEDPARPSTSHRLSTQNANGQNSPVFIVRAIACKITPEPPLSHCHLPFHSFVPFFTIMLVAFFLSAHLFPVHLMTSISRNWDILQGRTQWQTESFTSTWSSTKRDSSGIHLHLHYFKVQLLSTAGLLSAI